MNEVALIRKEYDKKMLTEVTKFIEHHDQKM